MSYLKRFSMDEFVETGTNYGDTLDYISRRGVRCRSIELSRELYKGALVRFNDRKNVTLLQGDSAQKLPEILKDINTPALFWLDGHYSGGNTACGVKGTPILDELQAIFSHPVTKHVILIDDARFFDGNHDYPKLDEVLRAIREDARYSAEVSIDIIRIVPCTVAPRRTVQAGSPGGRPARNIVWWHEYSPCPARLFARPAASRPSIQRRNPLFNSDLYANRSP